MRRAIALFIVLVIAFAGCAEKTTHIHGKVEYQGQPLTRGTVTFLASNNMTYNADIQPDGRYDLNGVPWGKSRVVVQIPPERPPSRANPNLAAAKDEFGTSKAAAEDLAKAGRLPEIPKSSSPAKASAVIPAEYSDPDKSGLTVEIDKPDTEYNIDLK